MSNAQKTSQSFDRYDCWRPAFEVWSLIGWTGAIGWVAYLYLENHIPAAWAAALATITLLLLIKRAYDSLKVLSARAALSGSQVTFMTNMTCG